MGYITELNTLLGLPKDFDVRTLTVGKTFTVVKERERTFPLHIAILMIDAAWNFYGYAVVNSAVLRDGKSTLEFVVLSLFTAEEQKLYKEKFIAAATVTGEIK
ncbi:MAG: hypothetical protein Q8L37_04540 [Candidatus Gottesmanbacteria bacterium]|nr:hypothetical protein [Candidatus Gottesmanbacteria bacterium]